MPHPSSQELIEFSLGRLPDAESASVESHVSDCRTCCETLLQLKADDTFVDLLQAGERLGEQTILLERGSVRPSFESTPVQLSAHPRYEILERIGKGGMGDVFKARHRKMERTVALKIIRSELVQKPAAVDRFQREVKTAAGLSHPNIVTAYDADQVDDLHFLVMEFVDGVNLDEVVRQRGPLPVHQACDFIRQAAAGLQHAHERGMIHRDIKPHNLMLTATGEVKILDFGLAAFAGDLAADALSDPDAEQTLTPSQLTQMGALMGTPDFMAPEQAQDAHTADIRADIYSLGCTFYTLLVGRAPFGERTLRSKIQAHTTEHAPPLASFRDDVPAEVEAVLSKMLAKDRTERYQTPAEVVQALAGITSPSVSPKAEPSSTRTRVTRRALAAAFAFSALLTAFIFYVQTDNGVVRVDVADESLAVQLNGRTIEMKDGETPLTIRAGERKLLIQRGEFQFETDRFQLRRGDKTAVTVDVLNDEVIVLKDGRRLVARPLNGKPVRTDETKPPAAPPDTRIVVELKDDGRLTIEGREVNSVELMNRLQWILKETSDREVHILPEQKFSGEPFRQLVNLVHSCGGKRVSWPAWVDEALRRELTGADLDPAVADAVDALVAVFEKYLRNVKAESAIVGEFPGDFPERVGAPLKAGVEKKLRDKGFELLAVRASPALVFELSGESYELKPYKGSVKLDIRWRIRSRKGGAAGHQGGGGALTTYGRKREDATPPAP